MPSETVSVVIPTWNRRELLRVLLEKLAAQTLEPVEVVVVDNGSEDDSAAVAEAMGATVIRMEKNSGFAKAVNLGIEACRGDLVAILNNDMEPESDWLRKMTVGLGEAWFACGKLLNARHRNRLDGSFDAVARSACACRCGHGSEDSSYWNRNRRIRIAPLTAALFRKEIFHRIGLLDERFESYLEDVDFGIRAAAEGLDGVYVADAVAFHQGSATLGRWNHEIVRKLSRNQVFLIARHFPRRWIRRHGWHVLIGQGLWGLVALRHGAAGAWLRGKWEGLRRYRELRQADGTQGIEPILSEGENVIRDLAHNFGLGPYWKLYFALTGGR